jgi:hypothetical protein
MRINPTRASCKQAALSKGISSEAKRDGANHAWHSRDICRASGHGRQCLLIQPCVKRHDAPTNEPGGFSLVAFGKSLVRFQHTDSAASTTCRKSRSSLGRNCATGGMRVTKCLVVASRRIRGIPTGASMRLIIRGRSSPPRPTSCRTDGVGERPCHVSDLTICKISRHSSRGKELVHGLG